MCWLRKRCHLGGNHFSQPSHPVALRLLNRVSVGSPFPHRALWRHTKRHHGRPDPDLPVVPQRISTLHQLSLDAGRPGPGDRQGLCGDLCPPAQPGLHHQLPGDERLPTGELKDGLLDWSIPHYSGSQDVDRGSLQFILTH